MPVSTQEHHNTISGLGFTVGPQDLQFVNEYQGHWELSGSPTEMPENYWLITTDGTGHNVRGHMSPQQILDWGQQQGWLCSYVAPYGCHVVGAKDEVQLHDWIRDRRRDQLEESDNVHRNT